MNIGIVIMIIGLFLLCLGIKMKVTDIEHKTDDLYFKIQISEALLTRIHNKMENSNIQ